MTVRRDGDVIHLEGDCAVEEAEVLAGLLEGGGGWTADVSQCRSAHSALIQALLRFRPVLRGTSQSAFFQEMIVPALTDDQV